MTSLLTKMMNRKTFGCSLFLIGMLVIGRGSTTAQDENKSANNETGHSREVLYNAEFVVRGTFLQGQKDLMVALIPSDYFEKYIGLNPQGELSKGTDIYVKKIDPTDADTDDPKKWTMNYAKALSIGMECNNKPICNELKPGQHVELKLVMK